MISEYIDIKTMVEAGKKLGSKTDYYTIDFDTLLKLVTLKKDIVYKLSDAINIGRYLGFMQAKNEDKE